MHRGEHLDVARPEAVAGRQPPRHQVRDQLGRLRRVLHWQEEAVLDAGSEAGQLALVDPPCVHRDPRARSLAEDPGQAGDRELLGAQQVCEHVARPDARQLVGVAHQEQVHSGLHRLDQLVGQQRVEHAHLVHHDQVGLERVVGIAAGLASRADLQGAV